MKLLLTRQPVEMPALRAWREKALNFLLQAILLFSGPPLLLDIVIGVQHGNIAKISADITYYVALTCFLLVKRIPFLLRATAILILGLGFHTYILMTGGLVSAGRLGILTDVIMAALLLGRLAAIVVWIAGGIAIAVGLIFFARQPVDVLADITSGLVKPSTLIAQGLFTVGLSGFLGGLVLWIFMRLNQSLHTTDQALAERDRTNTTLEQRVADRTTQLEQALDGLSRQLRYAEVLGHCSQLLLQQRGDATSRPALIETILHLLHSSVSASHLLIYRRNEHPMLAEPYVILGCAHAPQHHELILPTFAQIADMPDDIRQSLDAGQSFAGPVPGRFPDHPEFQQLFDQNGIQSVLLLPILLDGKPWGLLQATDCDRQRQWDSSSIQLLRTAAEMLATAQEGWAATQALAIREAQLRALRDALPDLLFIVHTDSTILDYHAPPHIQLILPPATFLGRPFTSLMPDVISSQAQFAIQRVTLTGEMETFEYSLWIDQQQQTYEARVVHIVGDTCMVVIRDITAQHEAATALLRAKEAAEAADHAKSTFLAHISHEIRTPLTAIIGMASLLRESPLSPSQREMATIIHTGSETLLGLIGDILDVSKIEAGQLDLILRPFDLSAVCRVAVNLMSHTAVQKNLLLNLQIDPQLPALLIGDSGRLRQVLVNLLSNAVKFTDHGRIDVIIEGSLLDTESCEVQITVRDTGVGIDTHQLSQIFKPFVQVNRRDHQVGGTGLGLTISKQLIDLMGGRLAVSSTLGEGTTFRLTLLLGIAVAESDQATVPQIAAQRTPQVLIVEDNTINQEVLRRMVEQLGALPTVTNNGQEAVNALCRATYDIVLMDIQMPVLDGEKATRLIRDMGSTIVQPQIVALTASALRGDRERYLEAGMDDYLSKPVQLDDLRRVFLRRSVDERQAALASEESASNSGANIDWATIERLLFSLQLPKDQAATLVCELYEHELANQLHTLSAAIESDDRSLIARLAHKLRGGSRQLGANGLAAACMALEVAAKDPSATSLTDDIANVRASYTETWSLIQAQLQTMIAAH